jgi:hypothetical protein
MAVHVLFGSSGGIDSVGKLSPARRNEFFKQLLCAISSHCADIFTSKYQYVGNTGLTIRSVGQLAPAPQYIWQFWRRAISVRLWSDFNDEGGCTWTLPCGSMYWWCAPCLHSSARSCWVRSEFD